MHATMGYQPSCAPDIMDIYRTGVVSIAAVLVEM